MFVWIGQPHPFLRAAWRLTVWSLRLFAIAVLVVFIAKAITG